MKKLVGKFLLLTPLILVLQLGVGRVLDGYPFLQRDALDEHLRNKVDIIYFGDSVLFTTKGADRDRRSIAQMVDDQLEGKTVGLVQSSGYDMVDYRCFLEHLLREKHRPQIILVPINFRSLSPVWPGGFEFDRFRLSWGELVGVGFYRPLCGLRLKTPPALPVVPTSTEDLWRKSYLSPLTVDHAKLAEMARLIALCRKASIVPFFYVTPINVTQGDRLCGPDFSKEIARKVEVCREAASASGVTILDLSRLVLDPNDFELVEHLGEAGRRRVAAELTAALNRLSRP